MVRSHPLYPLSYGRSAQEFYGRTVNRNSRDSVDAVRHARMDQRTCDSGAMAVTIQSVVYLDMDAVLLAAYQGRRGIELGVQADIAEGLERLAQVADQTVILAYPEMEDGPRLPSAESRIQTLRDGLNGMSADLLIVQCRHDEEAHCDCAKPGSGLIELAMGEHGFPEQGGWFIGADQEGVQSGRGAGLRTVRIGPVGVDHMSSVHRPDYEARDLLDAANHILVEELN